MDTSKLISPTIMWIIIFVGMVIIFNLAEDELLFNANFLTIIIFILAFIYWIYFFVSSLRVHKEAVHSSSKITSVIRSGPYKKLRHPIYAADIVLAIGIFFIFPLLKVFLSVIWLAIVLLCWMKLEEYSLIKKFGDEYKNYKKQVPFLIPKLRKTD